LVHIYTLELQSGGWGIRVLHGQALGATLRGHALPPAGALQVSASGWRDRYGHTDGTDKAREQADQRVGPKSEEKVRRATRRKGLAARGSVHAIPS
jgi:hypothetical protein